MKKILFAVAALAVVFVALSYQAVKRAAVSMAKAQSPPGAEVTVDDFNFRKLAFVVKGSAADQHWIYVYVPELNKSAFVVGPEADQWESNAVKHRANPSWVRSHAETHRP